MATASPLLPIQFLLLCSALRFTVLAASGTADGSEEWGYVQVRPRAHLFWWLYRSPQRTDAGPTPWPTVLWLQGGPGSSGVAMGNFLEFGPLDSKLKPRKSTWLQKADLLFVDNPVGTGFSYVEDESLLVKSEEAAATDLTTLLKKLYNGNETRQKSPLFVVAESYGGRYAVTVGLAIYKAIKAGKLKLKLGGVALGNSWISPEDFVLSWGPVLQDISRLDEKSAEESNKLAEEIKQQIANGQYIDARNTWQRLGDFISSKSNDVDFYNFLLDSANDPVKPKTTEVRRKLLTKPYTTYLSSKNSAGVDIGSFMNGPIRNKLKIIPTNMSWGEQSGLVRTYLSNDFMKPRINEVDELLSLEVNVTVYNGQVDLACTTKGAEAWIQKLKWEGLKNFTNLDRTPLYCSSEEAGGTRGFLKFYKNLRFYWILGAGHFVPVDQPCIALQMIANITNSPAVSS